jgi:fermentation-respiration switch protein FrsA (DUF1100 family)
MESGFTSIPDVAREMYPFLPVRWLVRSRFDALGRMPEVRAPILLLHARDDEYFPLRHAERLMKAARAPARLVVLSGGHNQAFLTSEEEYRRALAEFLAGRRRDETRR